MDQQVKEKWTISIASWPGSSPTPSSGPSWLESACGAWSENLPDPPAAERAGPRRSTGRRARIGPTRLWGRRRGPKARSPRRAVGSEADHDDEIHFPKVRLSVGRVGSLAGTFARRGRNRGLHIRGLDSGVSRAIAAAYDLDADSEGLGQHRPLQRCRTPVGRRPPSRASARLTRASRPPCSPGSVTAACLSDHGQSSRSPSSKAFSHWLFAS